MGRLLWRIIPADVGNPSPTTLPIGVGRWGKANFAFTAFYKVHLQAAR